MDINQMNCKSADEIVIGDFFSVDYVVSEKDVEDFARISGDWNPLHFDDEYASGTIFKRKIAHGLISLAKFSGIFGTELPGLGTLWESATVSFKGPVFIGEPYKAIAQVVGVDRRRVEFSTWVEDCEGKKVLTGSSVVIPITPVMKKKLQAK